MQDQTKYPEKPVVIINDSKEFVNRMKEYLDVLNINNVRMIYDMEKAFIILDKLTPSCVFVKITKGIIVNEYFERLKKIVEDTPIVVTYDEDFPFKPDDCSDIGAFECFPEREMRGRLQSSLSKAIDRSEIHEHNKILKNIIVGKEDNEEPKRSAFDGIITRNKELQSIFKYLKSIAKLSSPILLVSEKGSIGLKIANAIHEESKRTGAFASVNVNELDSDYIGETLFGKEEKDGSFRQGLFGKNNNGTVYIEEIDELSLEHQNMLQRVFIERSFFPVNCSTKHTTSARIIAGTSKDIHQKVQDGSFRRDLYFKLKSYEVIIPTLRDRMADDLLIVVNYLLKKYARKHDKEEPVLDEKILKLLYAYDYPGNISELESMIEMGISKSQKEEDFYRLIKEHIEKETGQSAEKLQKNDFEPEQEKLIYIKKSRLPTINEVIKELIKIALDRSGNRIKVAASLIGTTPEKFVQLMKYHKID